MKLPTQDCIFFKNINIVCFLKFSGFFFVLSKTRINVEHYLLANTFTNFQVPTSKKNCWILAVWCPQRPLLRCLRAFRFFIFQILSISAIQKVFWGHCMRCWRKSDRRTCITRPKLKIFNLTFFLVTSDDLDLTRQNRLKRILLNIPGTIHVAPSASFQFDWAAFLGEASNNRKQISHLWTELWRLIRFWFAGMKPFRPIRTIARLLDVGKVCFRIENRSNTFPDSKWGRNAPPPALPPNRWAESRVDICKL